MSQKKQVKTKELKNNGVEKITYTRLNSDEIYESLEHQAYPTVFVD